MQSLFSVELLIHLKSTQLKDISVNFGTLLPCSSSVKIEEDVTMDWLSNHGNKFACCVFVFSATLVAQPSLGRVSNYLVDGLLSIKPQTKVLFLFIFRGCCNAAGANRVAKVI